LRSKPFSGGVCGRGLFFDPDGCGGSIDGGGVVVVVVVAMVVTFPFEEDVTLVSNQFRRLSHHSMQLVLNQDLKQSFR